MTNTQTKPNTATEWLAYIEALHPKSIAMGLDRVKTVADKLQLNPKFPIITVAGTNGKGSVCAMLSQIYVQNGFSVGCYTSPHLIRYNERAYVLIIKPFRMMIYVKHLRRQKMHVATLR